MSWPFLPRDKRPVQSAEGDKHEWISDPHYTRHGPVITPIRQIPNHHSAASLRMGPSSSGTSSPSISRANRSYSACSLCRQRGAQTPQRYSAGFYAAGIFLKPGWEPRDGVPLGVWTRHFDSWQAICAAGNSRVHTWARSPQRTS
jgi:hypothetical protein